VTAAAPAPIAAAVLVVAIDCWVYLDAKQHFEQGRPVVFRAGSFALETPTAWFVSCVIFSIIFFPLYINARDQQRTA
jgi:cytochrome c oxidase assembly factor CtaG